MLTTVIQPYTVMDPAENMRRDAELLDHADVESGALIARVFGWNQPCLSRGFRQKIDHLVDVDAAAARGIPIVERPTGGMLALHGNDIAFGVAISLERPPWSSLSVDAAARRVNQWIIESLRIFGFPAELPPMTGLRPTGPSAPDRLCAASHTVTDITLMGRKLLGSSMRKKRGAILYEATLPLGPPLEEILDLLRSPEIRQRTLTGSTWLSAYHDPPSPETLADCLAAHREVLERTD